MNFIKTAAYLQIALQIFPSLIIATSSPAYAEPTSVQVAGDAEEDDTLAKAAAQAGTLLSSNDASSNLASTLAATAAGQASSALQQWLSQFGTAKVAIATDRDLSLQDASLDLLLPLYDGKENILFTQLGSRRQDDRVIINGGVGYRYYADAWMLGYNIFYDYQSSSNHHRRIGIGGELGWDYMTITTNGYFRLSNWMASQAYSDEDERAANGFDIRASGYLPAYPQLGANLVYEQYYGDHVGLFGDDDSDRQKDPHAITLGVNYTPVPLITLGVNQKYGKGGKNATEANLAITWSPGVPLSLQLDPDQLTIRRSLQGGRHNLVERNNTIVLDHRKQTLVSLSLPTRLEGSENGTQTITGNVTSKYAFERIDWQADDFYRHGGKITSTRDPQTFVVTLPAWQSAGVNSYTLTGIAWDSQGNASKPSQMQVLVNGIDVTTLQSTTVVEPGKIAADGVSTALVAVTLKSASGDSAIGLAKRLSATLTSTPDTSAPQPTVPAVAPSLSAFSESTAGVYTATITSGTTPDTLLIQPTLDGTVNLQAAKLTETTISVAQLATLEASASSAPANGTAMITLTAHVSDQNGNAIKNENVLWSADNAQVVLSASSTVTDDRGNASVAVSSSALINTVVTAQLSGGNSLTSPTLQFTTDPNSAKVISIDSSSQQVVANGNDTVTYEATVTDEQGNALPQAAVTWSTDRSTVTLSASQTQTDKQGKTSITATSLKAGDVTVSAQSGTSVALKANRVAFIADATTAKVDSVISDRPSAVADGTESVVWSASVSDANDNPVSGINVSWSSDNVNMSLSATGSTSDDAGVATTSGSSRTAGTATVSAALAATAGKQSASSVAFIGNVNTARLVSLKASTDHIPAGAGSVIYTAVVQDANGNVVPSAAVAWTTTLNNLSSATTNTDGDGVATVSLSGTLFGNPVVTATINGSTLQNTSVAFMGTIEADWNIINSSGTYTGTVITEFPTMGFLATGATTGPRSLKWGGDSANKYSTLTIPMTNAEGDTFTVTLRGQRQSPCNLHDFNNAVGCQSPRNNPRLTYAAADNPSLPAGVYTGDVTFNGKDYYSSWALSYTVHTTLTVN